MHRRTLALALLLPLVPIWGDEPPEKGLLYADCMSYVTQTRTARTVGKGRLCISWKFQEVDYDEKLGADDDYHDLTGHYHQLKSSLSLKYGWARYHHIGCSIPYVWNDIETGKTDLHNHGLSNIAVFEKWNFLPETRWFPAIAADAWWYLGTGDTDRKLGTTNSFLKLTTEISKTWPKFSLHLNPVYVLREGPEGYEINAAAVYKPCSTFWPVVEYNFESYRDKGRSADVVPCFIWKFRPGWALKFGTVINVDSTKTYRDHIGLVGKLSYTF